MKTTKPLRNLTLLVSTLAIAATMHAQSFLTNGLVAYFPFNGNANDASGNGHNATISGATLTTDRFGVTNAAYHFSGGQYIDIPVDSSSQKPLTYSFWFKQDTSAQWPGQALIWAGTFDAQSHDVGIRNPTNNLYIEFYPNGTQYSNLSFHPIAGFM